MVVHELAHQWFGDSLAVAPWQNIWLNEGFATYAEWLWSEHEGLRHGAGDLRLLLRRIPTTTRSGRCRSAIPGPTASSSSGLRPRRDDTAPTAADRRRHDFFTILRTWAKPQRGANVTTDQFIALAEKVSGQQLDELFQTWLFGTTKPVVPGAAKLAAGTPEAAQGLLERHKQR